MGRSPCTRPPWLQPTAGLCMTGMHRRPRPDATDAHNRSRVARGSREAKERRQEASSLRLLNTHNNVVREHRREEELSQETRRFHLATMVMILTACSTMMVSTSLAPSSSKRQTRDVRSLFLSGVATDRAKSARAASSANTTGTQSALLPSWSLNAMFAHLCAQMA